VTSNDIGLSAGISAAAGAVSHASARAVRSAVVLGPGEHRFRTNAGEVPVAVDADHRATLTSVATSTAELAGADLRSLLAALRWDEKDLDPDLPPRVAYAGAYHPVPGEPGVRVTGAAVP
jgi:predicted PhzF superfamily epimerase YddE/YHI9